ncbi:hypothetical protein CAPTEDRAFT_98584, partial [Capitella teleta]
NYGSISLIDVLSKTIKTQLARHITKHIIVNECLPNIQYDFCPKHPIPSTPGGYHGSFFYRVDREQLVRRLQECSTPTHLLRLLKSHLKNKTFHVRLNGAQSDDYPLDIGVLQGSGIGLVM